MRKWKSPSGVTWVRCFYAKGAVRCLSNHGFAYRLGRDGHIECYAGYEWYVCNGSDEMRAAIAELYPPPTKDQLWRKVARLAGELIFACSHSIAFNCAHPPAGIIRAAVYEARKFRNDYPTIVDKHRQEKIIAKLEAALAAWEAAQ